MQGYDTRNGGFSWCFWIKKEDEEKEKRKRRKGTARK